jgi:ribosome maturation factor RimP
VLLPVADMAEARLVLTDALIEETLKRGKQADREAEKEFSELGEEPAEEQPVRQKGRR